MKILRSLGGVAFAMMLFYPIAHVLQIEELPNWVGLPVAIVTLLTSTAAGIMIFMRGHSHDEEAKVEPVKLLEKPYSGPSLPNILVMEEISALKALLPNRLFPDSKCWQQDSLTEKVECLLGWLRSDRQEIARFSEAMEKVAKERDRFITVEKHNQVADQLHKLALAAQHVDYELHLHGGSIVPHLLDTDDNAGQFMRNAINQSFAALRGSEFDNSRVQVVEELYRSLDGYKARQKMYINERECLEMSINKLRQEKETFKKEVLRLNAELLEQRDLGAEHDG